MSFSGFCTIAILSTKEGICRAAKGFREDRDETQRQMAALLNVGQSTYSMYENGQREIPLAALCKLADHYDVTLDYLVGRNDAPGK